MDTVLAILAVICGVVGIAGSILPALPGPPLAWVGLLLAYFRHGTNGDGDPMSLTLLLVMLGLVVLVSILDYIVPAWFTKVTGGSKYAERAATVGLLIGMFIPGPIGMIGCSLIFAFLAEMFFAKKGAGSSIKAAFGAFLGFLCGTGFKLIVAGVSLYYIIVYL